MNVLVLHSRYLSGDVSGENRVVRDEVRLLREGGHSVELISREPNVENLGGRLRAGLKAVWSTEAMKLLDSVLRRFQPAVAHAHNLFPTLSPAILRMLAAHDVPVVLSLHNYRLMCLPADFLRNGRVCELCLGRVPWRGVVYGCYRGSRAGSAALAASLTIHRLLGSFDGVRRFLAVSPFVRDKYLEAGFPSDRVRVKPNFVWPLQRREGRGQYFLYLGRLSSEKGIDSLAGHWHPAFGRLVIAGDGPLAPSLREPTRPGVDFLGPLPEEQAVALLQNARALLVPSIGYEGAPRVILEAYSAGVPVVASRIGALTELVPSSAGILAIPGNAADWERALGELMDEDTSERLGVGAFQLWKELYAPDRGLAALEGAYKEALNYP